MGILFDKISFTDVCLYHLTCVKPNIKTTRPLVLGLYNRGSYGTGHGWSAAHSVAWNVLGSQPISVQKPPTAQNYAVGCTAPSVTGAKPPSPFKATDGYIERYVFTT